MKQVSLYRISTLYEQTICEQVLSCCVVMIIPIPLPQHQHTFLSETTFRPGLPWSSSGRNEQNESDFILFILTWRRPGQSWSKHRLWQKVCWCWGRGIGIRLLFCECMSTVCLLAVRLQLEECLQMKDENRSSARWKMSTKSLGQPSPVHCWRYI